MRVVLKNNCFQGDVIKVNGVPILFDDKSEAVVEIYGGLPFQLELIQGRSNEDFSNIDEETFSEKNEVIDKAIKKGAKWFLKKVENVFNTAVLRVACRYEISGYLDREYIIIESDFYEFNIVDDFGYAYMYPMLANAKGRLLSCEGINKKAVLKSQPIMAFADNAFFGVFEGLISMPIVSVMVRSLCRDKKIYKKLNKALADKRGFDYV